MKFIISKCLWSVWLMYSYYFEVSIAACLWASILTCREIKEEVWLGNNLLIYFRYKELEVYMIVTRYYGVSKVYMSSIGCLVVYLSGLVLPPWYLALKGGFPSSWIAWILINWYRSWLSVAQIEKGYLLIDWQ